MNREVKKAHSRRKNPKYITEGGGCEVLPNDYCLSSPEKKRSNKFPD